MCAFLIVHGQPTRKNVAAHAKFKRTPRLVVSGYIQSCIPCYKDVSQSASDDGSDDGSCKLSDCLSLTTSLVAYNNC